MSKQAAMTEAELSLFAERVYGYWHEHAWEDHMLDIAYYVLDLLRQGYTVQDVLKKLKVCHEIARAQHDTWYADLLEKFHRAARRGALTEQWVRFHLSGPGSS